MSSKDSSIIDVGYPIYGAKFVNNKTIVVTGGGGEGNNGIPNKITAVKCSFKVSDKSKRLQKFREIVLPKNEDSPMCMDIAKDSAEDEDNFSIFVGCNQSTQLLKSMNINNNLRKYVFTSEEHLRFVDAAQLEEEINADGVGEYPKIVCLSSHNTVGCLMTSCNPSFIYIFNPDLLELNFKFRPDKDVEIVDFHLSPNDDGKTLCYITASSIETVSTITGNSISSTNAGSNKALTKYNLSKVRFIDDSNIIVTASMKNGKGVSIFQYSIPDQKILKQRDVSRKIKGVTAADISISQNLVALAGNDTSVTILRLSDFKTIKTFTKLHSFAITKVAFSPRGSKLASVSAANTLHVMKIPQNYSNGKSVIGTLVHYIFITLLTCLVAIFLQKFYENGQLEQLYELSNHYGQVGFKLANEYGLTGYQFVKDKIKGENVDGDDTTKHYFKMDDCDDNETLQSTSSLIAPYSSETTEIASTIIQSDPSLSNDNIDIRAVTKDIEEITKDSNLNTESLFNDTNNYVEEYTIVHASNASENNIVEPTIAEATLLVAAETHFSSKHREGDPSEIMADISTEAKSESNATFPEVDPNETEEVSQNENEGLVEPEGDNVDQIVETDDSSENEDTQPDVSVETDAESETEIDHNVGNSVEEEEDVADSVADETDDATDITGDERIADSENENSEEDDSNENNIEVGSDAEMVEAEETFTDFVDEIIDEKELDYNNKREIIESDGKAEVSEQEHESRDTDSNELGDDELTDEPITEAKELQYQDDNEDNSEHEYSNPDPVKDIPDTDFPVVNSNIEEAPESIEDSYPVDTPVVENIENEVENEEIDHPRPANPPVADPVYEEEVQSEIEDVSDTYLVEDSTFDQTDSRKEPSSQTTVNRSVYSEYEPNSVVEQEAITVRENETPSTKDEYTSKLSSRESSTTKLTTTKTFNTKLSTKPSTIKPSTAKLSTTKPTTKSSSIKSSSTDLSTKSRKVKSTKPKKANTLTIQPTTELPQKGALESKISSDTTFSSAKTKSSTSPIKKSTIKKAKVPKRTLSRKLSRSKAAKPKTTSQSHDEL